MQEDKVKSLAAADTSRRKRRCWRRRAVWLVWVGTERAEEGKAEMAVVAVEMVAEPAVVGVMVLA